MTRQTRAIRADMRDGPSMPVKASREPELEGPSPCDANAECHQHEECCYRECEDAKDANVRLAPWTRLIVKVRPFVTARKHRNLAFSPNVVVPCLGEW